MEQIFNFLLWFWWFTFLTLMTWEAFDFNKLHKVTIQKRDWEKNPASFEKQD